MKIGRNDFCWCGSGLKYKKCHLSVDSKLSSPQAKIVHKWIKTPEMIEGMKKACSFNAKLMDYIRPYVSIGAETEELDRLIKEFTLDNGHIPACLNYRGYPKCSCISPNEVVCHGIPSKGIRLKDGDIVNVDVTTIVDGYFGDQSETFLIGQVSDKAKKLVQTAANSMIEGILTVKPGALFSDIGDAIENYAVARGFSVVVDFTGHGIGKKFHEDPPIYHFKNKETSSFYMAEGMTFTIEPMINEGTFEVDVDEKDDWTVRTRDRLLSAQFEHTILVTSKGFEVLTLTDSQKKAGKICHLSDHKKNII